MTRADRDRPRRAGPACAGAARCTVWRRSIQARVVISTAAAVRRRGRRSVGWVLLQQITDGLRRRSKTRLVGRRGQPRDAPRRSAGCSAADGNDFDAGTQLRPARRDRSSRAASVQGYEVVLAGPIAGASTGVAAGAGTSSTPGRASRQHPGRAAQHGRAGPQRRDVVHLHRRSATPTATGRADGARRGHRLAGDAAGRRRHLHALLPLPARPRSRRPSRSSRRALLTGGALLLVLVGGLTWLVTRQVVTPVRLARRVAERLASGRLEERMQVARRGRPRPAGDVVQPDGRQPAAADPPARGAVAGCSAGSSPTSPTSCAPR